MVKRQAAIAMLVASAFSFAAEAAPKDAPNSLVGVWTVDQVRTGGSVDDRPQPSLYFFTKKHYSIVQVIADKPRETVDPRQAPAETLRAIYVDGFAANAGSYQASGGTLTIRPSVAKSPSVMRPGASFEYRYEFRDGTLLLTETRNANGPVAQGATRRLTRVE